MPPFPDAPTSAPPPPKKHLHWYQLGRFGRIFFTLLGGAFLGILGLWIFRPFPHECLQHRPPQSTLITDQHGTPMRAILGSDGSFSLWQPIEDFGPWLPQALIAAEDKRFLQHHGIDLVALSRAFTQNIIFMRRISGASTISTQVIRLAQPRPRVVSTKFIELFLATQMERHYSKEQILEQYLNRAPFGGNFIGAEAAARKYFGKRARDLSIAEAALIAGLPQSPNRHRPDRYPGSARARRAYVLERMHVLGFITTEQYKDALLSPIPTCILPYPFEAPHFCTMVIQNWNGNPPGGEVRTTLDLSIQSLAEDALRQKVNSLPEVHGGAVLLLSTTSKQILAWVGSPDFDNLQHSGQFDSVLAWRSPGSTLKPFAYALAMDQGRITPSTILPDIPRQYGSFSPGNFDGTHRGTVSAHDALVYSLNTPALEIVSQCGVDPFLQTLSDFGIHAHSERSREHNGLGTVIGNTETRLLDLTLAYAQLAQCITATNPTPISPAAAWLTLNILSGDERAPVETGSLLPNHLRKRTAWKTGTSAGFRDAWTLAVNPSYTLGVWLGNPNARPALSLVGIEAAAPLAFQILQNLPSSPNDLLAFPQPDSVILRPTCPLSGMPPNPHCPNSFNTFAIQRISSPIPCSVHQPDSNDDGSPEEVWPQAIQNFKNATSSNNNSPSPSSSHPHILSPAPNAVLQAGPLNAGGGTLLLRARGSGHLYWFLDGSFLADAPASNPIRWSPTPGKHTLRCCNSEGASSEITFEFLP